MLSRASTKGFLRSIAISQRRLNSLRYKSINEFNKQKKVFRFGCDVEPSSKNSNNKALNSPLHEDFQTLPSLENHPKLKDLRPNLAEYRYQLSLLHQEFQSEKERERAKWEYMERITGLGAGVVALVGIIATYTLVMNYKYIKTYCRNMWAYDVDISQVKDMNDPRENKKSVANLIERLNAEADLAFVLALKDSKSVPGLYLFGAFLGKKLPLRVQAFDGMFLSDVLVNDDYVVAVDDNGRVFHYGKKFSAPVEVSMPGKIEHVLASGGKLFYFAKSGRYIYYGDTIASNVKQVKGWFSSAVAYNVRKVVVDSLGRSETFASAVSGNDHLLLLTSQGRLFGVNSADVPLNKGQFGLPKYTSFSHAAACIPKNVAFELTNLNNEVVSLSNGTKAIKPRTFSLIAATNYASAAVESNGNLWTWGDNSLCQCGRTITVSEDWQPVPKVVYSLKDLARILKYSLEDMGKTGVFSVDDLSAANNTFFVKMSYHNDEDPRLNQDLLLSFGDGLRGQLGVSRYLQMSHVPLVVKSLVGMKEYDEATNTTSNIGIKSIVGGGDHVFVTLDNSGLQKDVLAFGENLKGQFGNGRTVKSAKPTQLPKLLEPADFDASAKVLAMKVNDQTKNRLQLGDGEMSGVEQVLAAGEQSSAIYYRRK